MDSVHVPWGWLITLAVGAALAGLLVVAFDDTTDAGAQPFCDALLDLREQQAASPPERLTSLTRAELVLNAAEQRNAALPVIAHLPPSISDTWIRVHRASTVALALVINAWPERGSGRLLRAEATAAGFDSITAYVLRDAFFVDGEPWTWNLLVEAGDEMRRLEDDACST